MSDPLHDFGANGASAVAGAAGAVVAALRSNGNLRERLMQFLVGFCCALWLPALIVSAFSLTPAPSMLGALGFVFGYFGIVLLDRAQDALNTLKEVKWAELVESWLRRK